MCRILDISRASYYKWSNRGETDKDRTDWEISQIIIEYDLAFNHILGYRRMTTWINHFNGTNYNVKRIRRLMKKLGISSVIRRRKSKYIKSKPEITAENILNRKFTATKPNEKWLTDVTEFKVVGQSRKVYLSAIIDLYDKSIVEYQLSNRNDNSLVFKNFDKAIALNLEAHPTVHSDRGYQYTSKKFKKKLDDISATQSMSRVGKCIDNGPCEGFWGILKSEMYYLHKFYDEEELRKAIVDYITFYNTKRLHGAINSVPSDFRKLALKSA